MNHIVNEWEENFAKMLKKDEIAKAQGKLVGRVIKEQFADGYAYYEIIKETKNTVKIKSITGIGDDWIIPYWGKMTTIEKEYVVHKLEFEDKLDELFRQRQEQQN